MPLEMWAGFECTLNRVGDRQHDQFELLGHYRACGDIDRLAALGVRTVRYPILWERMADAASQRQAMEVGRRADGARWRALGHHTDRRARPPRHPARSIRVCSTTISRERLAAYARLVAARYPWVTHYTPVNEPLTTARFSALYGLWYPHLRDDASFIRAMLNQVRATRLAMAAIRTVNPDARSSRRKTSARRTRRPRSQYQADFENERRWLTFDLLAGRIAPGHPLYEYAVAPRRLRDAEIE